MKTSLLSLPENKKPHIVILGAGASVAAFPEGDANGRKLPTMDNLVDMLGLEAVLERDGIKNVHRNFEDIYSELYQNNPDSPFIKEIEEIVYTYFDSLKLPKFPTMYDHLLMSLQPKDIVASFNWDPFLFDAWNRIKDKIPVPNIIHLHGNVRLAYCPEHHVYGEHDRYCPKCDRELIPSRLLYPIKKKNYQDPFIASQWAVLVKKMRQAFTITIFGYRAPTTDTEAVNFMHKAWDKENRFIERTEIINKEDIETICKKWAPFIIRDYLDCHGDFYQSRIANYPRRTCEALLAQTFYGQFVRGNQLPSDANFDELFFWLQPLVAEENQKKSMESHSFLP